MFRNGIISAIDTDALDREKLTGNILRDSYFRLFRHRLNKYDLNAARAAWRHRGRQRESRLKVRNLASEDLTRRR